MNNLLKDDNDLNEEIIDKVRNIKYSLLKKEVDNLDYINIYESLHKIIESIPFDVTPLEKVRYVYINLGLLFCYDYRVAYDMKYAYFDVENNKHIRKYQTCLQISEILNNILNNIPDVKSTVIPRRIDDLRGAHGQDHVANKVELENNGIKECYLLDLTLDLFYIQSGLKTRHFGFETDKYSTYDIIPQIDNMEMDRNIGIPENLFNMDNLIEEMKYEFFHLENILEPSILINSKLNKINLLLKEFSGYYEGKQFVNYLFKEILRTEYKEYNLFYLKDNNIDLKSCFKISYKGYVKWVMYSKLLGIIAVDTEMIEYYLNNGYQTKSTSLLEEIRKNDKKI